MTFVHEIFCQLIKLHGVQMSERTQYIGTDAEISHDQS